MTTVNNTIHIENNVTFVHYNYLRSLTIWEGGPEANETPLSVIYEGNCVLNVLSLLAKVHTLTKMDVEKIFKI